MDIVTDLTAEAVNYIIIIQDICKENLSAGLKERAENGYLWDLVRDPALNMECTIYQKKRIGEVVWTSSGGDANDDVTAYFFKVTIGLLNWLEKMMRDKDKENVNEKANLFSSPHFWRSHIREILYRYPDKREELVDILHYMPMLIVLALSKISPSIYQQRLYQVYEPKFEDLILNKQDQEALEKWWSGPEDDVSRKARALSLLANDRELLQKMNEKELPVPFESLFIQELDEIVRSRERRQQDREPNGSWDFPKEHKHHPVNDPIKHAEKMQLAGLAFSGGGIRSATFNLGLLQKLAELGVLARFDYLSTVSGGGYIGSWFTSWIKRIGSVEKVSDRLNTKISVDPLAEEVRPIRWLRMFSNYLSPNSSIMSIDAWTIGMTWLRNTLINQLILLLLLLTVLSAIIASFWGWVHISEHPVNMSFFNVLSYSAVILLTGAVLAGSGMRAFDKTHPPQSKFNLGKSWLLPHLLVTWGILSAFLVTTWFYAELKDYHGFSAKLDLLLIPSGIMGFFGMVIVAGIGRYYAYTDDKFKLVSAIIISSAIAALAGVFLLTGVWQFIEVINNMPDSKVIKEVQDRIILITGIPLILEAISISVVVRMMLMGILFADDRREWWGRMGALIHRFMLIWILITVCSLVIPDLFENELKNPSVDKILYTKLLGLVGGWAAVVGYAVKLAFQSKTSGDKPEQGASGAAEIFIRFAPYLFMLGFLLIGAVTLRYLNKSVTSFLPGNSHKTWLHIMITALLGLITFLLSWRVGVNEFSLHHFYRNRLVRAYLGATRRRTDRENTANSFTGFDVQDDMRMATLVTEKDYIGPYPIINTSLNATEVSELDRQDRKAESFMFSPFYCGFDFSPTRSAAYTRNQVYEYGYRPTKDFSMEKGPLLGTAMAISGAAVNPNQGYHSSPATAFLLTMFNVRLGWWIGNPRLSTWKRCNPRAGIAYLVKDLIGKSDINSDYVCLSDGGHFDNMGLYELIRRRCTFILLGDAEEDQRSTCEGLANAIRLCRIDFGVEIDLDVSEITKKDEKTKYCEKHTVKGTIKYPGHAKPTGTIIYVKTALTGNEPVDIREYFINNPEFPQQSTADQFFDEAQFESYRKLGYFSIKNKEEVPLPGGD